MAAQRKHKRIMVYVRDAEQNAFLKSFFRKASGYRVEFTSTAVRVKKNLREKKYDLLVTSSPKGLSTLSSVTGDIPVVALISSDFTQGVRAAVNTDVNCYLVAPFNDKDFDARLRTAISGRKWFATLYREKKDLETMVELSYLLTSTLDPREVLYFIVKKISEMIDLSRCSILSMGYNEKRYAYVVSSYEDPAISGIKLDLRKYPEIKKVINEKKPVIINDAMKDRTMLAVKKLIAPIGIKSIMVLPIIFRDEVIGTLFLRTSKKKSAFSQREIKLCNAIANVASNALYNAFLFERLENEKSRLETLAVTDYLTGIFNIRYLYHRFEEEFSRAQRYSTTLGCIMMDIDYFKKINDTYGHRTGDMILREFAQLVKRHIRKSDIFARYGGEEFILILPHTTSEGSRMEAERIRSIIKEHRFSGIKHSGITVSMGIAHYPDARVEEYEDLITLADDALFEAKRRGRDTYVINHQHLRKSAN